MLKEKQPKFFKFYNYSKVKYTRMKDKIMIICPDHGEFETNAKEHLSGCMGCKECGNRSRKTTLQKKYGVDNYFERTDLIKKAMLSKHGVHNPGLMKNHLEKSIKTNKERYGVKWGATAPSVVQERKNTNIERYGFPYPIQNKSISKKMVETKIKTGGFTKSNSSQEATKFILDYIIQQGYDLPQCAFASKKHNLHEWGYYDNGKWMLFDLVVFNSGFRGNKDEIIEILEYNGPFHYTKDDVANQGNEPAFPWKTNKTTIKESYMNDLKKSNFAKSLTTNFNIIWSKDL